MSLPRILLVIVAIAAVSAVGAGVYATSGSGLDLETTGPDDGQRLGSPDLDDLVFEARAHDAEALSQGLLTLDGADVTDDAEVSGEELRYEPGDLDDGQYELTLDVDRDWPDRGDSHTWVFEVDTTPPEITVDEPEDEVEWGEPATIAGTAEGAEELTIDDESVDLAEDGSFEVTDEHPTEGEVEIEAVDDLGNVARTSAEIAIAPREPPGIQGVHITAYGWADPDVRDPIVDMVEDGLINTIQLDIKDEDGAVGYDSQVELAQESGAARGVYDLDEALQELEELDVHVVGRIVAFADPILTRHLWDEGERDMVIQTPDGERYTGAYAGFTNFAHPDIRQYNIDLAREAAEAGFDDILWDYVRRPDGSLDNMVIPGLDETPEEAVVGFVAEAEEALADTHAWHGASVYGIAADRPTQIGQDIPELAQHLDYVAPMVYPSHWGPGEYDVADPNNQPYDIVAASLTVFQNTMAGTEARLVPWLQDFSLGATYGPEEVRAQIEAASDLGIDEFLLWNAASRYTRGALE